MNHINSRVWPATRFDSHNGVQVCFNWSRLGLILGARCVKTVTEAQPLPRIIFVIALGYENIYMSSPLLSIHFLPRNETRLVQ
jgi:hypothetical protein